MRSAQQWLQEYSVTHQNPLNKRIHKVCVPAIFWAVFALLWAIPPLAFMATIPYCNWATLVMLAVLAFYLSLGVVFFVDMFFVALLTFSLIMIVDKLSWPLAPIAGLVFVVAWIGQFYGHKVEGKKPAFIQDILFLLIGPLWIVNNLKRKS